MGEPGRVPFLRGVTAGGRKVQFAALVVQQPQAHNGVSRVHVVRALEVKRPALRRVPGQSRDVSGETWVYTYLLQIFCQRWGDVPALLGINCAAEC